MRIRTQATAAALLSGLAVAGAGMGFASAAPPTNTVVKGTVSYYASDGTQHRSRTVHLELRDADGSAQGRLLHQGKTSATGSFRFTTTTVRANGQPRRLFVVARSEGDGFIVGRPAQPTATYSMSSAPKQATGTAQSVALVSPVASSQQNGAFSIADALVSGVAFGRQLNGGISLGSTSVLFPDTDSNNTDSTIRLRMQDRYDWDVILHEYGHYLARKGFLTTLPGAKHSFFTNLSESLGKSKGTSLAWSEGLATWLGVVGQQQLNVSALGIPKAGDTAYDDGGFRADLASSAGGASVGEDDEAAIARILWLFGHNPALGLSTDTIVSTLVASKPTRLSAALPLLMNAAGAAPFDDSETPVAARVEKSNDVACQLTDQKVVPKLTKPAAPQVFYDNDPPTFEWDKGGAGPNFPLTRFTIQFWSADWQTRLYESPAVIGKASWKPSESQWQAAMEAIDASGTPPERVQVVIKGTGTWSPVTGPYKGCAVEIPRPAISVTPVSSDGLRPKASGTCATLEAHGALGRSNRFKLSGRGLEPSTAYDVVLHREDGAAPDITVTTLTTAADGSLAETTQELPAMQANRWTLQAKKAGSDAYVDTDIWVIAHYCVYYEIDDPSRVIGMGGIGFKAGTQVTVTWSPGPNAPRTSSVGSSGDWEDQPHTVPCAADPMQLAVTGSTLDDTSTGVLTAPCHATRHDGSGASARSVTAAGGAAEIVTAYGRRS